jgi:hypothetical protein
MNSYFISFLKIKIVWKYLNMQVSESILCTYQIKVKIKKLIIFSIENWFILSIYKRNNFDINLSI